MRSIRLVAALLVLALSAPGQSTPSANPPRILPLDVILEKTAAYCRALEASVLDFVCLEEVKETIDPSLDVASPAPLPDITDKWGVLGRVVVSPRRPGTIKRSYVYDYQCVRSGGAIRETRTLIEENGKKRNVPNAALKTAVVVFGTALQGPVGLLEKRFQGRYQYQVIGLGEAAGRPSILVDVRPKPGTPASTNLYGKVWVDRETADILKIEWSENRVGRYDVFRLRGERFGRTPHLTIVSEFRAEKNGIRFPTRLSVEESYRDEKGKAFLRSTTSVTYKDFRFFTVEVEHR